MNTILKLDKRLLGIIGRRVPAIYDLIHQGPGSRYSAVALNPQPLPPHELGAAVAAEFVHTAWLAERFGHDPGVLIDDLDDWCPTRPKFPKLPPWWPPIPEPEPHPDWSADFHLGFIARLATLSVEGTGVGQLIDKAIERSIGALESSASAK